MLATWKKRLDQASKSIHDHPSYLPLVEKCSRRYGSGIGIFKYLWDPKRDETNCMFRYCIKNGTQWAKAKTLSRVSKERLEAYLPETMIAIAVLLPTSFYPEAKLVGDVYLYNVETYIPVSIPRPLKTDVPQLIRNRSYLTQI